MVQKAHKDINRSDDTNVPEILTSLPLTRWMHAKGRDWFPHQIETLHHAQNGKDVIVFAPTGAGKTLSGFLPSFADLHANGSNGHLHTIYISPLKALAADVHRNISAPINDMGMPITYETRTGDTSQSRRQRQKKKPPDIIMTTPESLALLLSYEDASLYFKHLKYIIIDELHALLHTKRGDLLSLNLERLRKYAPKARRIGLSATLADQNAAKTWFCRRGGRIVTAPQTVKPHIDILKTKDRVPWSGHSARYAVPAIYDLIRTTNMAVVFVNTRAQAEYMFQNLWQANDDDLKIGIHHGSLEKALRQKVETHMANGTLNCVVATGSLDLGIDWADVDLVIQVGAPKGVSRLLQRIGRSNHRLNEPSRAVLVPTNRLEYIECLAAVKEIEKGAFDGITPKDGALDVLAQHIFATACTGPFHAPRLYNEIKRAAPYRNISEKDFYDCIALVKDGGYALKTYDQFSRLVHCDRDDWFRLRDPKIARRYRMNVGTIVEAPILKVMMRNRTLGSIEENFINTLSHGDTFMFGGQVLKFEGVHNAIVKVRKTKDSHAQIPSYAGGRMPLSTHLAHAVRAMIGGAHSTKNTHNFPDYVREWLDIHRGVSALPDEKSLLIETFPHRRKHYTVAFTFAGRNANQTLGFLAMRKMKRLGLRPLGFIMTDYAVAIWSFKPLETPADVFNPGLIYEDFEEWLYETPMVKRLFRDAAIVSGLIERRHPGHVKTGRQVLVSSDLIFDVLMKYEPGHILLKAAYEDAKTNLIEADRVQAILHDFDGHIVHRALNKISPLSVPIVLQLTRETVSKKDKETFIFEDMEAEILEEAGMHDID